MITIDNLCILIYICIYIVFLGIMIMNYKSFGIIFKFWSFRSDLAGRLDFQRLSTAELRHGRRELFGCGFGQSFHGCLRCLVGKAHAFWTRFTWHIAAINPKDVLAQTKISKQRPMRTGELDRSWKLLETWCFGCYDGHIWRSFWCHLRRGWEGLGKNGTRPNHMPYHGFWTRYAHIL